MKARVGRATTGRRDRALTAIGLQMIRRQAGTAAGQGVSPLFIVGSGRSGNTLVRRVLMATGGLYVPPETFVLGDIIEGWIRTSLLNWREKVWLFCAHFERHEGFATFKLDNLDAFAAEAIALPPGQRSVHHLIDAFYRYLARAHASQAPRWGDKTPYNTFHLPALGAAFPQAQHLWLVRDGRDVVLSYVEAGLFDSHEAAARRWIAANSACKAHARGGQHSFRQSYEQLVRDPEACFAAICDWAGLPFSPAMLTADIGPMGDVEAFDHHRNVVRPISPASVGRWRSGLTAAELRTLPPAFWQLMDELGYDRDGAG